MNNIHIILSLWLCLWACSISPISAQQQKQNSTTTKTGTKVNGVVVDENNDPLIGASIMVVGSSVGTITDMNGKFSIVVPEKGKYRISFIGYVAQTLSNLNNPKIILKEDAAKVEEVIIVGYGSLKSKNVTGSIEVIDPEDLKDLSVSNLSEALIGLSSSIHVDLPGGGRPGETADITIRQAKNAVALVPTGVDEGGKPIGGDNNPSPLYVIDDFISTEEDFNNIDIDEVESISILKDASAAVYGAYSAYGVILVKTKRGKAGVPKISYTGQFGFTDAIKHAKMLNAYDYGLIYNAARAANTSKNESAADDKLLDYFQADELEAMKGLNYNLLDKYWSSALTQRHSINISGGTEKVTYFGSVSYYTEDGNIGKLDYDRWNYRAGINTNISKYVKASLSVSGDTSSKNAHMASSGGSGSEEDYNYMLKNPPYVPDQIGIYPIYHSGMQNSPSFSNYYNYQSLYQSRNNREDTANGMSIQASLEHDLSWWKPLKGLRLKLTYSRNVSNSKRNDIRMENTVYRVKNRGGSGHHLYITDPTLLIDNDPTIDYDPETLEGFPYTSYDNLEKRVLNDGQKSYISREMSRGDSYQMNMMLIYAREFGLHNISGTFSIEKSESESENVSARGSHPLSFTDGQSSSLSDDSEKEVNWARNESGSLAYIGRLNYSYADKYLFEFLFRSQASTKFSPQNYWGYFPSVSAGWVISEESWFNKEKTGIDFLKIRASFGLMGRDNVEPWRWTQLYSYNEYGGSIFGTDPNVQTSRSFQLPEKSGTNPNLRWDKNYKTNFGIDLNMLDNRLTFTLEGYYDFAREMFDYPSVHVLPGTVGIYAAPENFGKMDMYGAELSVGWRQKITKDLSFRLRLSTSWDDNKVIETSWVEDPKWGDKVKNGRVDRGSFGLSCIGMFRSYQQIDEYFTQYNITSYLGLTKPNVHPGMLIYEDIRGPKDENGNYTAPDGIIDSQIDVVELSHRASNPYNVSSNLNITYKSFTFNATVQANWGAYTQIPGALKGEKYGDMETTNISAMWKDMFVYNDVTDSKGNILAYQNRNGRWPNIRYTQNSQNSTFWRVKALDIILRNVSMSYTVPKEWIRHFGVSNIRLNLTCQNALSFYNNIPGGVWSNFAGSYGKYPRTRKITLGVNVSF